MRQLDGDSPQQGARARSRLSSVRPHLLSAIGSAEWFLNQTQARGPIPKNWTHLEIFISTWNGPSKYPPHQLLPTGQMFLQIQGPVRWPSRPVHRAVIREAAKDKKPPRDH